MPQPRSVSAHPGADSYWMDTATPAPRAPALEESRHTDVLIIGAGFTGLLTALYGIGQIVGPPLVAWLLARAPSQAQGFDWALGVAAGALVLGAGMYAPMAWCWAAAMATGKK